MHIKRSVTRLMLTLLLVLCLCPAAFGAEGTAPQDIPEFEDGEVPLEIMDKYYTLTEEEVTQIRARNSTIRDTTGAARQSAVIAVLLGAAVLGVLYKYDKK